MNDMVDWISRLPDDVLNHILSGLTAKEVVQTCILSKRWRNNWASVSVLNFQLDDFDNDCDRFGRFVDSVFENRGQSCLRKVIYVGEFEDTSHGPSMEWLDRAALLMPRAIIVSIFLTSVDAPLIIPYSVFSCESLEDLVLSVESVPVVTIIRPKSIALPSLHNLVLHNLSLDDDFAQKLFVGCPSLESLKLEYCNLLISDISSNMLKKLTVTGCCKYQHMRICCPSLISLSIRCWSGANSTRIISLEKMTSLVSAQISLNGNDAQILSGLSNATSLKFYLQNPDLKKEQWSKDITKCRTFRNLKSLEIIARHMINNFDLIAYFLEHSPLLQKLSLKCGSKKENMIDAEQDVSFLVEHLETVDIHYPKDGKLPIKLMSMLDRCVKTFGNINISLVG